MFSTKYLLCSLLCACIVISSCRKNETNDPYSIPGTKFTETGKTIVAGIVLDEDNEPVSDAVITVGSVTLHSDANGVFIGKDLTVAAGSTYVLCKKQGYFNSSRTVKTQDGGVTQFKLVMAKHQVKTFTASVGINTNIGQAMINIPANGIVKAGGTAYNGTVTMASRYINPSVNNFSALMPGGDFAAIDASQRDQELYSYGAIEVVLTGSNGEALQLKTGSAAQLNFPIQTTQQSAAPATLPLWYFDEQKGKWIEEGVLARQGNSYIGTVQHFTAWNADKPVPPAFIEGTVTLCDGKPARGVEVIIGGEAVITDANGRYESIVCSGEALKISIATYYENGSSMLTQDVPALNAGEHKQVNFTADCQVRLTGELSLCDTTKETGITVARWEGGIALIQTDVQGHFNMNVPKNKTLTITAYGYSGVTGNAVTITTGASNKDLGKINICDEQQSGEVSLTLNGGGFSNKSLVMNKPNNVQLPEVVYGRLSDKTRINKAGTDGFGILITTAGKVAGNQQDFSIGILYSNGAEQYILQGIEDQCTLTIAKYGAVGSKVEGTFSGTFKKVSASNPTGSGATIQVTNGKFSLIRVEDDDE